MGAGKRVEQEKCVDLHREMHLSVVGPTPVAQWQRQTRVHHNRVAIPGRPGGQLHDGAISEQKKIVVVRSWGKAFDESKPTQRLGQCLCRQKRRFRRVIVTHRPEMMLAFFRIGTIIVPVIPDAQANSFCQV